MVHGKWCVVGVLMVGVLLPACRSIRARYVGDPQHGEEVGGLPVVVMQPRYLRVTYKTVTWQVGKGAAATEVVTREIETESIEVGEVYAVDLDRPAAGTSDYEIELGKDRYYPAKIGAKIDDKTIATTAAALEKLTDKLASPRERAAPEVADGRVRIREDVERVEVYDLRNLAVPIATWERRLQPAVE